MTSISHERNLILISLLVLAAIAWISMILPGTNQNMSMSASTIALDIFLAAWIIMMVAMMFPTAAPMILTFALVHRKKREQSRPFIPTWIFVAGYIIVWSLFGILAYFLAANAYSLMNSSTWIMNNAASLSGTLFIFAGLYQLSPLKRACLSKCRTPFDFITSSWREGHHGAFIMGVEHGLYCLGCCWLLFLILFPLGLMNIISMILITVFIFAEKTLPLNKKINYAVAGLLIAYGLLIIFMPAALPIMK